MVAMKVKARRIKYGAGLAVKPTRVPPPAKKDFSLVEFTAEKFIEMAGKIGNLEKEVERLKIENKILRETITIIKGDDDE